MFTEMGSRRKSISRARVARSARELVGAVLRTWRREEKLTPAVAADKADVSLSTWQRFERGDSEPSVTQILAMESFRPGLASRLFPALKPEVG